ncbi:hypothetical protein ACKAV7_003784 [Fusarium commune]
MEVIQPFTLAPWEARLQVTLNSQEEKEENKIKELAEAGWAVRIATSSSARNDLVGMGGAVRIPISVARAGKISETFSVTLGMREEHNPYTAELAAIAHGLNYLPEMKYRVIVIATKKLQGDGNRVNLIWLPRDSELKIQKTAKMSARYATEPHMTPRRGMIKAKTTILNRTRADLRMERKLPDGVGRHSRRVDSALPVDALSPSSSPQRHQQSTNYPEVLVNVASWPYGTETSLTSIGPNRTFEVDSISPSPLAEGVLRSPVMGPRGDQRHSTREDDICGILNLKLHNSTISGSSEGESISGLPDRSASPNLVAQDAAKSDWDGIRQDGNVAVEEEDAGDGLLSDVEYQSEDAFETDLSSKSDVSDAESEMGINDADTSSESDLYLAKGFLERTWRRLCDCQQQEKEISSEDARSGLSLKNMADYWRNLAVPDAIGIASPQARTDENEHVQPDWRSLPIFNELGDMVEFFEEVAEQCVEDNSLSNILNLAVMGKA